MSKNKDQDLAKRVDKLYSKLNKEEMRTLIEWAQANCETVKGNKCEECGSELEKTFLMTKYDIPMVAWVCPKSEIYQAYRKKFELEYHKH